MRRENHIFRLGCLYILGNLISKSIVNISPIIICSILVGLLLLFPYHYTLRKLTTSYIIFIFLGALSFSLKNHFRLSINDSILKPHIEQRINGIISDISYTSKGGHKVEVKIGEEYCILYPKTEKKNMEVGDSISSLISPIPVKNFNDEFDYVSYMHKRKIFYTAFPDDLIVSNNSNYSSIIKVKRLRKLFDKYLMSLFYNESADNYSIIKALTIGDKNSIDQEVENNFKNSGTMHLLALSGLHVGIIYKILSFLLSFLGNYPHCKKIRSIFICIILLLYAIFTGLSNSILRAVIMVSTYSLASIIGRKGNNLNTLAISAIIICTINPDSPYEVGFQLSFLAMLGIFLIFPKVKEVCNLKNKALNYIWNILAISISCQLSTAPVVYYHFGTFSHFSLLSNLILLPITSLIMCIIPIVLCFPSIEFAKEILTLLIDFLLYFLSIIS